jgi:competence protein ComEC
MQKILQYIPGFRSGTNWKNIIALLYYLFTLLMLGAGVGIFLFFLAAPFFVFSIIDLIRKKKSAAIVLLVSLVLMITGLAITPSPPDDQLAAEQPANQQPSNQLDNIAVTENNTEFSDNSAVENAPEQSKEVEKVEEAPNKQEEVDSSDTEPAKDEAEQQSQQNDQESSKNAESAAVVATPQPPEKPAANLKVHFIDVGQGDCILIEDGTSAMLIDAGNPENGPDIVSYIKKLGINRLDFVIATHPHADHIGGMADVINAFDIGKLIMPKVEHTTRTFENLLLTIRNKGLKITAPVPGTEYRLGNTSFTILAPNSSSYKNLNDYSVVVRLTYGSTSFLFTGDAEQTSEKEILAKGYNIKSDVLKVGHHGSKTSTTTRFLDAVSPRYAVICVGANNQYGHPAPETLSKLAERGIKVYRTDEAGTIIATSDGKSISFNKQPSPVNTSTNTGSTTVSDTKNNQNDTRDDITVYITKTGSKYHREGCSSLRTSSIPISLSEAKQRGYEPCKICKPPQ